MGWGVGGSLQMLLQGGLDRFSFLEEGGTNGWVIFFWGRLRVWYQVFLKMIENVTKLLKTSFLKKKLFKKIIFAFSPSDLFLFSKIVCIIYTQ